ncbi:protein PTST homolog 3, chloroplastic isoform X2 [Humulus lupulus]|uniref:protein PTST homolog 3, chloroplastic isoform X2 n=1 Tax=Humulus lupulus TaxID=3486 RepID=UPI002B40CC96|nr:protein PTST homolog 3, chloroplastic isoform X2 [Humulus lupulus]
MASTLYHFPSFNSLHPYKLVFLNQRKQQELRLGWYSQQNPPHKRCRFRVSSIRKSRKVKDNAELCKEIREFMAVVGLPESHVPTMKDFSQHGRSDLAYIVRRRGYKLIGELLASTIETDAEGFILEKGETENKNAVDGDGEVKVTGQDEKDSVVIGDFPSSVEASVVGNRSGSLVLDTNTESDDYCHVPVEGLKGYNEKSYDINEDGSLATEVSSMENHFASSSSAPVFDSENHIREEKPGPAEASLYRLEVDNEKSQLASSNISPGFNSCIDNQENDLTGGDEMLNTAVESVDSLHVEKKILQNSQIEDNSKAEEFALEKDTLITEKHLSSSNMDAAFKSGEHSSVPVDLSALSLDEKVANFMHYGHLDTVEDNSSGILNETGTEESQGYIECVDADEVQSAASTSEHSENVLSGGNVTITLNGSSTKSTQAVPAVAGNRSLRDENLSAEEESTQFNNNWDIKTIQKGKPVGISELKFMLHQKEQELSRLKEQIEKQKNDLSVLQAKADTEISKAQKLIFEKDAELQAAEETLSGLVEVEIKYCGDGEIVEVTGSFNGWHHCIKMDPDPQSTITDPSGPRKSKLWSTVLWLYPGVYEIKFIIDGHWKIDPDRESVTHGDICNNILRVEG